MWLAWVDTILILIIDLAFFGDVGGGVLIDLREVGRRVGYKRGGGKEREREG